MKRYAIIVAGGSGTRMGTAIPKQFLLISGRPLLMYTLEAFSGFTPEIQLVLVLPAMHIPFWKELCTKYNFTVVHRIVEGGETRGDSVKNGLNTMDDDEALVAVHDGARPFIGASSIEKSYTLAQYHGAAAPSTEITDSVRIIENGENKPIDRKVLRCIQTPQCFRLSMLRKAYAGSSYRLYTDDAGLVGSLGISIQLFEGNPENIKITSPFDLQMAEAIVRLRSKDLF